MKTKAFEIRDRATFIPVIAIQMTPSTDGPDEQKDAECFLLCRAGFSFESPSVILCRMESIGTDRNASFNPYTWGSRTYCVAHKYIIEHFDELESGAVIDVEFILGESKTCKVSERFDDRIKMHMYEKR